MPRLFFALWPDYTTREKLAAVADRLAPDCGRKVSKQNLHITLAFLGNVEDSCLHGLLAGVAGIHADNFSLRLDTIGCWKRPRLLWLAPSTIPAAVSRLVSTVSPSGTDAVLIVSRTCRAYFEQSQGERCQEGLF